MKNFKRCQQCLQMALGHLEHTPGGKSHVWFSHSKPLASVRPQSSFLLQAPRASLLKRLANLLLGVGITVLTRHFTGPALPSSGHHEA